MFGNQESISTIKDSLTLHRIPFGSFLIKEGEIPKGLFFILKGTVSKLLEVNEGKEKKEK